MSKEIHTKSIQLPREDKDGIRICIMRRPGKDVSFNIWIPELAPSDKLLDDYHAKKITWEKFEKRFKKEVLDKKQDYLEILLAIGKTKTITLLCWEETPEKCHRRLVVEKLKEIDPQIKICIL